MAPTETNIAGAARALRAGELVGMPTETVYGLAADALDPRAVARVFEAKRRPSFDPLIVHVASLDGARALWRDTPPAALALADAFWPGPLTIVAPRTALVPDLVTSGLDSVAIRVPAHPVAQALLRAADTPLAAPSANPFGAVSPTRAAHVADSLGGDVWCVLDGGPCGVGLESTIVSLAGATPTVLRFGGLPLESLEAVVGPVGRRLHSSDRPEAPGQLTRHYATRTPLRLRAADEPPPPEAAARALLVVAGPAPAWARGYGHVELLSPTGDLTEAAACLFAAMRALDAGGYAGIDAIPCAAAGLGAAIVDRLVRAAA
ncbi:MAG: threonylcarbamoyl-AMP synthase [Myxococcales bacterium]|nr:threonylcarbamoyl-AMP synthase [Myxococcales bacterium]